MFFPNSFSVYLIDDVLASLDAHVAKHIVKHCILGVLKDRTRILVTENRTLFYYSNQILHCEAGRVTTSDYALGSIESDHFECDSSSSDELNTPVSFELTHNDSNDREKSTFQVNHLPSLCFGCLFSSCRFFLLRKSKKRVAFRRE